MDGWRVAEREVRGGGERERGEDRWGRVDGEWHRERVNEKEVGESVGGWGKEREQEGKRGGERVSGREREGKRGGERVGGGGIKRERRGRERIYFLGIHGRHCQDKIHPCSRRYDDSTPSFD